MLSILKTGFSALVDKRIWRRFWLFGLIGALISYQIFLLGWFRYESGELSQVKWQKPAGLLVISNVARNRINGVTFLRLKDGKEQFLAGNWTVKFTNNQNAFVFGRADSRIGTTEPRLYYFEEGRNIWPIKIDHLKNPIVNAQENPKQTYIFIDMKTPTGNNYCLIQRIGSEAKSGKCQNISISGDVASAVWHPKRDQDLLIKTEKGKIYVQNPWELKPQIYDLETKPEEYRELEKFFKVEPSVNRAEGLNGPTWFYRFLNVVFIEKEKGWTIKRVPLLSKVAWIRDDDHLLIKQRSRLSILELSTDKLITLYQEKGMNFKTVIFRNLDFDQSL